MMDDEAGALHGRRLVVTGNGKIHELPEFRLRFPGQVVAEGKLWAEVSGGIIELHAKVFDPRQVDALAAHLAASLPAETRAVVRGYRTVTGHSPARWAIEPTFQSAVTLGQLKTGAAAVNKSETEEQALRAEAEARRQAVSTIINGLVAEWIRDKPNTPDRMSINEGPCAEFAEDAEAAITTAYPQISVDVLNEEDVLGPEGLSIPNYYHTFLRIDGLYFDAEAPEGVAGWRRLPFFRRNQLNIVPEDGPRHR